MQILQRAENVVDNFIYEILEKLADHDCKIPQKLVMLASFNLAKTAPMDQSLDHAHVLEEVWYRNIPFQFRR